MAALNLRVRALSYAAFSIFIVLSFPTHCGLPSYVLSNMSSLFLLSKIKRAHQPDYLILFCFAFLLLGGLVALSSASSNLARINFGEPSYYLTHQILYGLLPGLLGFFLASKIYYGVYRNRAIGICFLIFTIILLALVFSPLGFEAGGASRWLRVGPITFQPAELLKLALPIYLANWLSQREARQRNIRQGLIPLLFVIGIISTFLILQHSTSPVLILIFVALLMYYISGARLRYILGIGAITLAALVIIISTTKYRADRILTFLNPEADPYNRGFHFIQAKMAIGAGGLTGVGFGQSTVKFRLPEPIGDSIFAVIAEEFGFIGSMILLGIITTLVLRILFLARETRDRFGQLLLVGFGSIIGVQSFVNIGAMSGILPLTGTTLPFISYGGN